MSNDITRYVPSPLSGRLLEDAKDALEIPSLPAAPRHVRPPVDPRSAVSRDGIKAIAEQIFRSADPTFPGAQASYLPQTVRRMYVPSVHGPAHKLLFRAIAGGRSVYLQGACVGVGASILGADTRRAFNLLCAERGDPRRIARLDITRGVKSEKDMLESLCDMVQSRLSISERKLRSTRFIVRRVLQGAQDLHLSAIIIDHVHKAEPRALAVIADLIRHSNPDYGDALDDTGSPLPGNRVGIILIDHHEPETIFGHDECFDVLPLLQGNYACLKPYEALTEIADALREADIGLNDVNPADPVDQDLLKEVLEATDGLVVNMVGLLEKVDILARNSGIVRPNLDVVLGALAFHRRMIRLIKTRKRDRYGNEVTAYKTVPVKAARPRGASRKPGQKGKDSESKRKTMRESRGDAAAENREVRRRRYTNLKRGRT